MKKLFPILVAVALFASACQAGGAQAQPTALSLPTAFPTNTPDVNAPVEASGSNKAGSERVSAVDGMSQVYIPDGTFRMGGMDPDAKKNEKPDHSVTMKGFWMDKLEVTNGMYLICVKAGSCEPPQEFKSETRDSYFNNTEFNDYPVVYVSWLQAESYCKWAGRRLPTEAEWERSARGDDFRTYTWGEDRPDSSRGNFNNFVGDTTRAGNFPAGASPFGVLDLAGNVAEWTNDFFDGNYYSLNVTINPPGPGAITKYFDRVVRGGTFRDKFINIRIATRGNVRGSNPDASDINSADYLGDFSPQIGFRCASN